MCKENIMQAGIFGDVFVLKSDDPPHPTPPKNATKEMKESAFIGAKTYTINRNVVDGCDFIKKNDYCEGTATIMVVAHWTSGNRIPYLMCDACFWALEWASLPV